ncbi:hypothetical protein F7725_004918 [Dissostichus mawsoni]|uniref:Uncharacterized protein n=1 Tax=Dissostichus mawsoni TaxID=36200 RepID=A0A7J5XK71_DISMA|nr:hypothetical protein F7725_004918 [Dissostichus mawsoni]
MVATELMNILGSFLSCCAAYTGFKIMMILGMILFLLNFCAQQYFHVLTCVERYLAVVHPIIFLKLRGNRAVRIRNVTIVCVWLLCFGAIGLRNLPEDQIHGVSYLWTSLFLFVILFCSLSVVWVLIRPKPGVGKRVDRTKVRALYLMMVILGVLVFRFGSTTIGSALYHSQNLVVDKKCLALFCMTWTGLPSSLVLPLLYLHRAGKLTAMEHRFLPELLPNPLLLLQFPSRFLHLHPGLRVSALEETTPGGMNPLDVFTFHMVVMELFGMSSSVTCFCGAYKNHQNMVKVGCNMFAITSCVKMFFHVLTCMERYMAVVHPLTYRNLSKSGGVMIRNICVGFVWFLLAGLIALRLQMGNNFNMILFFCNLVLSLIVSSFCNISVVRVLNRAGPGEEGANAGKTDKLKQKALVTITAIMTVLLLRFSGNLICLSLGSSQVLSSYDTCVVLTSGVWFCLPSGYVLPLLFLHRAEKLPCLKYNKK